MQARYYDPVIGRFYSNDPVDALSQLKKNDIHGFNRYVYANNNPYKYTDPDGRDPSEAFKPLSDFFNNIQKQARQAPNDLKVASELVGEGLVEGGRIAGEATAESLSTASTVAGLVPGGQVASIILAAADVIVNNESSNATGALASGATGSLINDSKAKGIIDTTKSVPQNKMQAIKMGIQKVAEYLAPQVTGAVAAELDKQQQTQE
jgi:uncharacterized protein RhaS with RHS repeats